MTENSRKVFDFVKEMDGKANITAKDIAEAIGLDVKKVNGSITMAFQKKELMKRVPSQVQDAEGKYVDVKYIVLTEKGRAFDPDAETKAAE